MPSLKEIIYESIFNLMKDSMLIEMAVNKSRLDDLVQSQYNHIARHYVKLKSMPDDQSHHHWKTEIIGSFSRFRDVKYSHNKKRPSVDQWIHHCHNNSAEFGLGTSRQYHYDLEDEGYKVGDIDHHKTVSGFHEMMRRCFTRIHSDQKITHDDIY